MLSPFVGPVATPKLGTKGISVSALMLAAKWKCNPAVTPEP